MTADFSSEIMKARRMWSDNFKFLKKEVNLEFYNQQKHCLKPAKTKNKKQKNIQAYKS